MAYTTPLPGRVRNFNFKGEIVLLGEVILLEEGSKVFYGGRMKWYKKYKQVDHTKIFSFSFIFQVLQMLLYFEYFISSILINIIINSLEMWSLFWKKAASLVVAGIHIQIWRYYSIWTQLSFSILVTF